MAIIILPEKYDKELEYQQYFQWVIVMSPLATYGKMHRPSRWTLTAGAKNKINEVNYQSYTQRYLTLNSPSSQNQVPLNSANVCRLKYILNISTHIQNLQEQRSTETSGTKNSAQPLRTEENLGRISPDL